MPETPTKPRCKCHGEEMGWKKDPRYRGGGHWRCQAKNREQSLKSRNRRKRERGGARR